MQEADGAVLERIASALERIADALQQQPAINPRPEMNVTVRADTVYGKLSEMQSSGVLSPEKNTTVSRNASEKNGQIEQFLASKNISIKTIPLEDAADDIINSLALFLGDHYPAIKVLLSKIKATMFKGGSISLCVKEYTQKEMSDICQFCSRLHEIAFLEQYVYFRSPKFLINAKTTMLPQAQNFFSGKWLERYVLQKSYEAIHKVEAHTSLKLESFHLLNPQVILPNGDDFELDLILEINGRYYWIEAKSGEYQLHISKYARISKIMGLDFSHSFMVLTDIQPEKSYALSALFGMTVYGIAQFGEGLRDIIMADVVA